MGFDQSCFYFPYVNLPSFQVADRILAEEVEESSINGPTNGAGDTKTWEPRLTEPLDLLLPLLLPEDSYPSDNPVPVDSAVDVPTSLDSGISSRPSSAKESRDIIDPVKNREPLESLITVDSIRQFLAPVIDFGWCRLSVRPIIGLMQSSPNKIPVPTIGGEGTSDEISSSAATSNLVSWSVYLVGTGTPIAPTSPVASQATTIQTDAGFTSSDPPKRNLSEQFITDVPDKCTRRNVAVLFCDSVSELIGFPSQFLKGDPRLISVSISSAIAPAGMFSCLPPGKQKHHSATLIILPKASSYVVGGSRGPQNGNLTRTARGILSPRIFIPFLQVMN